MATQLIRIFDIHLFLYFLQGVDAEYVSLENIVPISDDGEVLSETETHGQEFYDKIAVAVGQRIRECGPRVPVVTGKYFILGILLLLSLTCPPW